MQTDLFQSCGHRWVFQICWRIECSTFTASSFRIWNSSTGIPSPPLALWCFLRPTWLCIPGCLALDEWSQHCDYLGREDLFCIVLCILATSSYLLLLLDPYHFCPLLSSSLYEMFPWYRIFLKKSLAFPILLFSSISLPCSLWKAFLSLLAILWISTFKWVYLSFSPLLFTSCLFAAICKAFSDSHFDFSFFFLGDDIDSCLLYNVTNLHP